MSAEPIAVSLFDDVFARSIRLESMTLEQLAELIRSVTKPFKPQLPLLKLSRFGSTAVPHTGSYRHDQNLVACSGIEGDYDGEVVSCESAPKRDPTSDRPQLLATLKEILFRVGSRSAPIGTPHVWCFRRRFQ